MVARYDPRFEPGGYRINRPFERDIAQQIVQAQGPDSGRRAVSRKSIQTKLDPALLAQAEFSIQ